MQGNVINTVKYKQGLYNAVEKINIKLFQYEVGHDDNSGIKLRTDEKGLKNLDFILKDKRFGACSLD